MNLTASSFLSIDTSTEICSVSFHSEHTNVKQVSYEPQGHAKCVLPMIDAVLQEASCHKQNIDLICVTSGPGSFTGIRIGISIAQGLSYGLGCPILAVPSLALMALGKSLDEQSIIIPALDARMDEIYWAAYEHKNGNLQQILAPVKGSAAEFSEFQASLHKEYSTARVFGVGHGWTLLDNLSDSVYIDANFLPQSDALHKLFFDSPKEINLSTRIDWLGASFYEDAQQIEPNYVRNEVSWQKRVLKRKTKF